MVVLPILRNARHDPVTVPTFVAIDGEAIGQDDDARYAILTTSGDELPLVNAKGLRTVQILEWLLDLQKPSQEVVAFGLNYDVNQLLVDIPDRYLGELWDTGWIVWRGYKLEWLPARYLKIQHRQSKRWVTIQEVFGFFQCSLLDALEGWGFDVPQHLRDGKETRGTFTVDNLRTHLAYCQDETRLLAQLMTKVGEAAEAAGCTPYPHTWIGAGALASTLLRNSIVRDHYRADADLAPDAALPAIMTAYLGGRSEVFRQGVATSVQTFDIRSAYPSAARSLPSLRNAKMAYRRRWQPDTEHGVWRVRWSNAGGLVMPLPVRFEQQIWWPQSGEGWYHACEIRAALALGFELDVREGWVLQGKDTSHPFRWLDDTYRQRAHLEAAGNPAAARMLKLGTNSVYGKLAQSRSHGPKPPRWQSYFWAGELTARIRARMLEALIAAHRPVMVSTDGIFAADAPMRPTKSLGGWKVGSMHWVFAAKPGVYHARGSDGEVMKSSGFFARDVNYDELLEGWLREGVDYVHEYASRRFIGLGVALNRERPEEWRRWLVEHRALFLRPSRKHAAYSEVGDGLVLQPRATAPGASEPYVRKERLVTPHDEDNEQGLDQPLRTHI